MGNAKRGFWVASLALLAGCTVLLDTDKKQCKKDDDCAKPYVCGSGGVCQEQTGCKVDADCRETGICNDGTCKAPECAQTQDCTEAELCNTELRRCVAQTKATCEQKDDCKGYDGAQVCIKSTGLCGTAECMTTEDCTSESPTATCNAGACEDPTWWCLGLEDPRPAQNMSSTATLKVKVLYAFAQNGAKETGVANLKVKVCNYPDQNCLNPIPDRNIKYDAEHYVVVTGLETGKNYRIQLQADHPTNPSVALLPGEYLMYRTVVGETVDPKPILMFEDSVRDTLATTADVKVDETMGLLLTRIFDCTDTEVAGVQIDTGTHTTGCMGDCPTTVFYQNTTNLPDPGATETNSAGRAGIVNLKTGVYNRLTLTRAADNKKITSFVIAPHGGWVTYVHFWPWDYGTAAD